MPLWVVDWQGLPWPWPKHRLFDAEMTEYISVVAHDDETGRIVMFKRDENNRYVYAPDGKSLERVQAIAPLPLYLLTDEECTARGLPPYKDVDKSAVASGTEKELGENNPEGL